MGCALTLMTKNGESVVVSAVVDKRTTEQQPQQRFHKRLLTTIDTNNNDLKLSSSAPSRKRRRIVQFSSTTQQEVQVSSSFYVIDEEFQSVAWYNKSELDEMRLEARNACRQMRHKDMSSSASYVSNCSKDGSCFDSSSRIQKQNDNSESQVKPKIRPLLSLNEETRGLEHRICLERLRRKYLVGQFVLKAASKLKLDQPMHVAKLAWASSRITQYATKLAIEEASRDYLRVYHQS